MREIKFRAFSKKDNKMYYGRDVELWNVGRGLSCRVVLKRSEEKHFSEYDLDAVPMQFSDVYDKNERLVFEDDILISGGLIWQVKFGQYKMDCGTYSIGFYLYSKTCNFPLNRKSTIEVIGNMHENPELITA